MAEPAPSEESFGALLRPVELHTAGQLIAERLVTAIALGEFEPGQRLPAERELAATLEVSRTTVREALQRLHAGGLRQHQARPRRRHLHPSRRGHRHRRG